MKRQLNLCLDIGNSRAKFGLFENDILIKYGVTSTSAQVDLIKAVDWDAVNNVIISSTGNIDSTFNSFLENKFHERFHKLSHKSIIPIRLEYETPETLGLDRIATSVGASTIFKSHNCLIIDAGTCITLDLLRNDKVFLGGNISPGIMLRIKAMNDYTSKLPIVPLAWKGNLIGKNTQEALQNGAVLGTILEIESFISRIWENYTDLKVIFTGGDHTFFVDKIKTKIFAAPYLLMIGLNEIIKNNEV